MLRKLAPLFTILLSTLLDTSVIHVLYHGVFLVPLSLVVVIMIAILTKDLPMCIFYSMLAGLIIDVSTGTLGLKLFGYIAIGFLTGFMLNRQLPFAVEAEVRRRQLMTRIVYVSLFVGLYELVMLVYQYFSTAILEWDFARNMLIRICMITLLTVLLYPFFRRLYLGKSDSYNRTQDTREVKNY